MGSKFVSKWRLVPQTPVYRYVFISTIYYNTMFSFKTSLAAGNCAFEKINFVTSGLLRDVRVATRRQG